LPRDQPLAGSPARGRGLQPRRGGTGGRGGIGYECGAVHKRRCTAPHSYLPAWD
jgi:hypothetical protein